MTPGRCPLCGRSLDHGAPCAAPACVSRRRVDASTALARQRAARRDQAARVAAARVAAPLAQARRRLAGGAAALTVMAPFLARDTVVTPAHRHATFLAQLDAALAQVFADAVPPPDPAAVDGYLATLPPEPEALDVTCIACRGTCCLQGAHTHAFLGPEALAMQRHLRPDADAADLRAFYAVHLPKRAVADSCVFHGGRGCVLPRDRRAEICNAWQCTARVTLALDLAAAAPATPSIAVALDADHRDSPHSGAPLMRIVSHGREGFRSHDDLTLPALPPD